MCPGCTQVQVQSQVRAASGADEPWLLAGQVAVKVWRVGAGGEVAAVIEGEQTSGLMQVQTPGREVSGVVATVIVSGGDEKRSVVKVGARIWEMKTASRDSNISQYPGWGSLKVHRMIKHITG